VALSWSLDWPAISRPADSAAGNGENLPKTLFEISKRSRSVSMSEGTCFSRGVCMGLVQGQVDHVSMTHSAFGNNVVGNALHIRATPLKHSNFHATLLIEMHVQLRLCEVMVLVEIACEALLLANVASRR